jgi:hypothetical protein
MKATPGRIVMVAVHPDYNNGADEAPAMVCRAWGDDPHNPEAPHELVNLRVLLDSGDVPWLTSVPLYGDRAAAEAAHLAKWSDLAAERRPFLFAAWWPPRPEHQPGDRPVQH